VAYQPQQGDTVPPVSKLATTTGPSGVLIVLFTTLYNKPASGNCQTMVLDRDLLLKYNNGVMPDATRTRQIVEQHQDACAAAPSGLTPTLFVLHLRPNASFVVQTLTGGTQAKLLSKEQYDAGGGRPRV
jgi:hypothetical protein